MEVSDSNSSIGEDKVYSDKKEKLVLVSLLDLYSKFNKISVNTSRPLASFISYCLPTTYFNFYYLNQTCILIFPKREFLS